MRTRTIAAALAVVITAAMVSAAGSAGAEPPPERGNDPATHWTPARRQAAIPRDLVVDHRGLGYLRGADGSLVPYGHGTPAAGRPGGGGSTDTTPPTIGARSPVDGAEVGSSATFSAVVTDDVGVRSVTIVIRYPTGQTQSFAASASGTTWSVTLNGFSDGDWQWHVVAKDGAKGGGNTATSPAWDFTVDTGGGSTPPPPEGVVVDADWTAGGDVQRAAGRLFFEMPSNRRHTKWQGYVCSGTAVVDDTSGRSTILTAAHCVYDDVNDAFARNVIFIPDQAATTGTATDRDCTNDVIGCWTPSFGVVDVNWTTRTFPDNVAWDYAFYSVPDAGAHTGATAASDSLDVAVNPLAITFDPPAMVPATNAVTTALGYSYSQDPSFRYCEEPMTTEGAVNWWLPSCGLTGGSSGGPWLQPASGGNGPIISVNSWGYTNSPGMAGPKLNGTSASCVFAAAKDLNESEPVTCL